MNATKRLPASSSRMDHEVCVGDQELLDAARSGCHAAFGELRRIYSARLFKRILSITRNREDAEDALQETFLSAYRALSSFEGRAKFSTWLTRIAINSALMIIRRRRTRPEIHFEERPDSHEFTAGFDVADSALDPEQLIDQRQRYSAILFAIQRLDPKLQVPIQIWMSQDYSMMEIAQSLGVSLASVKSRIHRARMRLRRSTTQKRLEMAGKSIHSEESGRTCNNEIGFGMRL